MAVRINSFRLGNHASAVFCISRVIYVSPTVCLRAVRGQTKSIILSDSKIPPLVVLRRCIKVLLQKPSGKTKVSRTHRMRVRRFYLANLLPRQRRTVVGTFNEIPGGRVASASVKAEVTRNSVKCMVGDAFPAATLPTLLRSYSTCIWIETRDRRND